MSNDRQPKSSGKQAISSKEVKELLSDYDQYLADQRRPRRARSGQSATPTTHSQWGRLDTFIPEQSSPVKGQSSPTNIVSKPQRGTVDTAHRSAIHTRKSAHYLQPSKGNEGKGIRKTRSSKGKSRRNGSRNESQNKHVTFDLTMTDITDTQKSSVPDGTLTSDTGYSFLISDRDDPFDTIHVAATGHTHGDTLPPGNVPEFSSSSLSPWNMGDHAEVAHGKLPVNETDPEAIKLMVWLSEKAQESLDSLRTPQEDRGAHSSSGNDTDAECETDPEFGPG